MGAEDTVASKLNSPRRMGLPPLAKMGLFMLPSVIITAVSIALFALLQNFTLEEMNEFTITLLAAVILSLVGTAGLQLVLQRLIEEEPSPAHAMQRTVRMGSLYGLVLALVIGGLSYPYFVMTLGFSLTSFAFFVLLVFMYSLIWSIMAVFWALEQYQYPAIIFLFSYISLFILTYGVHLLDARYTLAGYTGGLALLLMLAILATRVAFRKGAAVRRGERSSLLELLLNNMAAILFQILYITAIFLDKIIVWMWQGAAAGVPVITGAYTIGSFLGLLPVFSVGVMVYFSSRARPLLKNLYQGRIEDIQRRAGSYKQVYFSGLAAVVLTALALLILTAGIAGFFINDSELMRVLWTVGIGAVFFATIVYNSTLMPLFGRMRRSTISVLLVCVFELASIPLLSVDIWFAALGFLAGSVVGFFLSQITALELISAFEYHLFRYATVSALKNL